VGGRIDATLQPSGEPQHRERPVGIPRDAEDEHLAVGTGALQVGGLEGKARHERALRRGQDGERIESQRGADLARSEHPLAEHPSCRGESLDVVGGHQPPS
jgi:hypothetical protein